MGKDIDAIQMTQEMLTAGFDRALQYFRNPKLGSADFTVNWLKACGALSRLRASRANEAAIMLSAAKMAGAKGEVLDPLWRHLTGQSAPKLIERSGSKASAAA